jgi:GDP-L-fucose synthase
MQMNQPQNENNDFFSGKRIWITGHRGMVGSALVRSFDGANAHILKASRNELDLTDQSAVVSWVDINKPDLVFHVGAKVGGIYANSKLPANFLYDNLLIAANVIDAAHRSGVAKLIFVASNCTYPAKTTQPIAEEALLTGMPDDNIRAYAVSKIAGIELCRAYRKQFGNDFISVIPPNLYGPGDNYHHQHSHVVAGIMRRIHEAKIEGKKEFTVWGDGSPRREILYVDDLVEAMKHIMRLPFTHDLFNVGSGYDLTISELAALIADAVGFEGKIVYDSSKPNGAMRKLLDSTRIRSIGWQPKVDEKSGLNSAYADLLDLLENPGLHSRL